MGSFLNFFNLVTLLFFAHVCAGQIFSLSNTETSVVNCGSIRLDWQGGTPPYTLNAVEAGILGLRRAAGDVVQVLPTTNRKALIWQVKLPAAVSNVRLVLSDSTGALALPKVFRVETGTDTSCLATSSSSTLSESTTAQAPSSSSDTASQTSSSIPSSSSDISTSALPSSSTPLPSSSQPELPAATSEKTTVTSVSTLSTPSASGGADQQNTGAAKQSSGLPIIAIVGIAAGGLVALIALIALILCYRKRVNARSDPLEAWDGGYDPESVLKVTQYNHAKNPGAWNSGESVLLPSENMAHRAPQNTRIGQSMYP